MTVNDPRPELAAVLAARLAPAAEALALALPDLHIGLRWPRNACPPPSPRRLNLFSTGCGGMGSHGWTPASPLGGGDRRGPG